MVGIFVTNDFTYLSSNGGASVIDYCLVPYEELASYENFNVHRVRPLVRDELKSESYYTGFINIK